MFARHSSTVEPFLIWIGCLGSSLVSQTSSKGKGRHEHQRSAEPAVRRDEIAFINVDEVMNFTRVVLV
jgi:hypothetical protein